jgi:predicted dehydrogenase
LLVKETPGKLVAVSDLSTDKMQAAQALSPETGTKALRDYRELLAAPGIDAVIIATPVFLHAEHFEAAVKAKKHIYIEKPAAASVADCKKIMQVADSAPRNLHITFGFQRRHGELYLKAKKLQDSGALGAVRWAQVQFLKGESERRTARKQEPIPSEPIERIKNWGHWRELSGDLIVENNIHLIDVMNWFVGAHPLKALGNGGKTIPAYGDMRDHGQVVFDYPGNVQGTLLGATVAPPYFRSVFEQFHCVNGVLETSENYWRHYRGSKDVFTEQPPRNISIDSVAAFVRSVAGGKPENTAIRGVESTLTAIMGRMAMDLRREVTWEEVLASKA